MLSSAWSSVSGVLRLPLSAESLFPLALTWYLIDFTSGLEMIESVLQIVHILYHFGGESVPQGKCI